MNIEQELETFYKSFRYTNLNVMDDLVLYSFDKREQAASVAKEAMQLIEKLGLNLSVEWNSNSPLFDKTVLIKGNE